MSYFLKTVKDFLEILRGSGKVTEERYPNHDGRMGRDRCRRIARDGALSKPWRTGRAL